MKRTFLLALIAPLSSVMIAQLSPREEATLFQHMQEVNREWTAHANALSDPDQQVSFANEADRIAAHLHAVDQYMQRTIPEGLSAEQFAKRNDALVELKAYAHRGIFPQNTVLPFRIPIFIDPSNTACAVGQLMITSGANDLAKRIDTEMETAYIRDMHWPEIDAWAQTNGFTQDELAWIQPGYPPAIPWIALGGGTDGTQVDELLRLTNGDLIVVGDFTYAGNTACMGVARWNGSDYEAMGTIPEGYVNTAIEFDGDIYLGGSFNAGQADLLKWNGSTWEASSVFSSKYGEATALHDHNGILHVAGSRSGFAGNDHIVMRLTNDEWNQVGQELNGRIEALESFDGSLMAGGEFTDEFLSQNNAILHVARLNNNTWEQLGEGLDGSVYDMLVSGSDLYAGGDMVGEVATYFGLAKFTGDALAWEELMPTIESYIISSLGGITRVRAMVERNGQIFLGGEFQMYVGMSFGSNLAVFNGEPDAVAPYAAFSGPINDLDLIGTDRLVASGWIDGLGNIATTDLSMSVEALEAVELSVFPNPTTEHVSVQLPSATLPNAPIRITDASGRIVDVPVDLQGTTLQIDVRALAGGQYFIELGHGPVNAKGRFVKN